jgi:NAD(P)-dependent dehydrogenase (short-subunit alcohol dehydrogenase family)
MARRLNRSVVTVTGATSGIGRASALAFARRGAAVVAVARRGDALDDVVHRCRSLGVDALACEADVSDPDSLDAAARRAIEQFGRLDVWVNNAAAGTFGYLEDIPLADVRRVLDANVMGYVHGARAALPWFREQNSGVLINVGSVLSKVPGPALIPYVMSKHAVRALSASLRCELLDAPGVHSCLVLPGAVDTPFFQHAANYSGHRVRALRPTSSPERVARVIVRCARHPRPEAPVGLIARFSAVPYGLAPRLTERVLTRQITRGHFADEPAGPTPGSLYEPPDDAGAVSGGWGATHRVATAGAMAAGAGAVTLAVREARRRSP